MSWLFTVVLLLSALVAPQLAKADIVFSNLTTATGGFASVIKGSSVGGGPSFFAASFLSSATYTLTDAEVAADGNFSPADAVDINLYLYSDSGGLPGTDLGEIGSGAVSPEVPGYTTVDASGPAITLTSGDTYWLVMGPANSDTDVFWWANGSSTVPTAAGTPGSFGSKGDLAPQFRIDGTPVHLRRSRAFQFMADRGSYNAALSDKAPQATVDSLNGSVIQRVVGLLLFGLPRHRA